MKKTPNNLISENISSIIFLILLWIGPAPLIGQKITQQNPVINGDSILITYNLEGVVKDQVFEIKVYSSPTRSEPLKLVYGDVGPNIKPGKYKQIVWQAKKEINGFKGNLNIHLEGKVVYTPFDEVRIMGAKRLVKGKTYNVTWLGGASDQLINMDFTRKDKIILSKQNLPNVGLAKLTIPRNIKAGKNYYLKISMAKDADNRFQIPNLTIRRRIPLGLEIIGFTTIGIATSYYFLIWKPGGNEPFINQDQDLPVPPKRPPN